MTLTIPQNFYKTTVATAFTFTGAGKIYVSEAPIPTTGWLVINASNVSKREIVWYSAKGTDGGGTFVTIDDDADRGLGGTTAQGHDKGETVRMNTTSLNIAEIDAALSSFAPKANPVFTGSVTVPTPTLPTDAVTKDYVDTVAAAIVAGGALDATTSIKGITKLSVAPASDPIAVGDNDPRVPTQGENDALAGTVGTPGASNKFVTETDQTGSNLPAGTLLPWCGQTVPTGFLLCSGAIGAISRTTYAALFAAIGTQFGAGNGSTTFNIPNMEQRVPVGMGNPPLNTVGSTGGEIEHTLSVAEMPAHTHAYSQWGAGSNGPGGSFASNFSTQQTGSAGSSAAHNNMQPYIIIRYIIKY